MVNCTRCGIELEEGIAQHRIDMARKHNRAIDKHCGDCKLTSPVQYTKSTGCIPWLGDVDDDFRPYDKNGYYRPGERSCGKKDCVQPKHIIGFVEVKKTKRAARKEPRTIEVKAIERLPETLLEALTAEQHSIAYRTGETLGYHELIARLRRERLKPANWSDK